MRLSLGIAVVALHRANKLREDKKDDSQIISYWEAGKDFSELVASSRARIISDLGIKYFFLLKRGR